MDSDLCETLADIQASCKHDIVDQMIQVQDHYQLCDLKSVEWARNLSCLRRLSRKRRRGAYDEEDEEVWFSTTLGRGSTNGHYDYVAVSYPWKHFVSTAACDTATGSTTASSNCDSAKAGGWKIQIAGNPRAVERSKVRDGVLSRAVAYAELHGTELVWIDRECVPQDEEERPHLHETAMQSMDLVYRWAKHPIALIFEGIWSQEEVDLLEKLLRGQIVEVSSFDGDYTAPPPDGEKKGTKNKSKESNDEEVDPLAFYPRFPANADPSLITQILSLLTRLTSDPWFSRAWIFQENYCAGAKMRLLIPHSRNISKAHAVDLFGIIPHELNLRSIAFFDAATKFCLAYLADARYAHSTAGAAACEAIIHRAGRYNLLHRYGFVSSTGSTSPTEIRMQAEAEKQQQLRRRHHRGHKKQMKLTASRPFSRAMSTTIFADLAARRITQPHDVLAIAANCCAYDVRLDTKALRSARTVAKAAETLAGLSREKENDNKRRKSINSVYESLSAAVLALWFLNGEVFKNMLPPPPEPLPPKQYPDITISPVEGQEKAEGGQGSHEGDGSVKSPQNNKEDSRNNDFDASDAPLSLKISTTLSPLSPPSASASTRTTIVPITPPPTQGTALSFLSSTALDSFIPPPPSSSAFRAGPLTFLKSCRFRDVQLCRAGVGTRGHMWVLDERIASSEWNGPVARSSAGGKWWRKRRCRVDPLALLAEELRAKGQGGQGHPEKSGGRYRWLAARLDAMVAVRAEERQKREEKRDRKRLAKHIGVSVRVLNLKGTSGKNSSASSPVVAVAGARGKSTSWRRPKIDEVALAHHRTSITTFDRCMADAITEAIRDGRDLILARLWDGAEDPGAKEDDDDSEKRSRRKQKKIYRGIFIWDESPQGEDGAVATSESSSDAEEVKNSESCGNGQKSQKENEQEAEAIDWSDIQDSDSKSDTLLKSRRPSKSTLKAKCRLPSRTKGEQSSSTDTMDSRPTSSSSSLYSTLSSPSESLSNSTETDSQNEETLQPATAPFKPTLAFTSHTPHDTKYRFDRRAALEESRIDKFVSLEVALDQRHSPSSPSSEKSENEVEKDSGQVNRRRASARSARSISKSTTKRRPRSAVAVTDSTPAPPVLRTKRWINGLGFLPSPSPPSSICEPPNDHSTSATRRKGTASRPRTSSKVSARPKEKSSKASAAAVKMKNAAGGVKLTSANGKLKVETKAQAKVNVKLAVNGQRSHGNSTWTPARMRLRAEVSNEPADAETADEDDEGEVDDDGDESWEEDGESSSSGDEEKTEGKGKLKSASTNSVQRRQSREHGGRVAKEGPARQRNEEGDKMDKDEGDEEKDIDHTTGERHVIFAWPDGLVRR